MSIQIPLSLLAAFSADRRVYQAFEHYIAPGAGRTLLVPVTMAYSGPATDPLVKPFVAGCPVPIEEISALLDTPQRSPADLHQRDPLWRVLSSIAEDGWIYDFIPMMPGQRQRVLRVTHPNGIRYGEVVR